MVNGACGSSYWKIEFPTGAGIAFTQFCKAITAAFEEPPATLAIPGGENHVFSASSSPSMKRLESILTPQLYDRLVAPIDALKKRGEAVKLSANVEDAVIQEFYLQLGEPQMKGETTNLLQVEPSFKFMQRVSKKGRKGNLVTQQLNYLLVTPPEDEPGSFTVEQMMESMSRGIVIMVDVLIDVNITYVNTIKARSKVEGEVESTKVLEEEQCRRQLLVRLESNTLEMADMENKRGKDVISWRISDVDRLLESEQYMKYLEEEVDEDDDN
jgi:hypothetical protein